MLAPVLHTILSGRGRPCNSPPRSLRHQPRCFTPPAKDSCFVVAAILVPRPCSGLEPIDKPVHEPVCSPPPPMSGLSRSTCRSTSQAGPRAGARAGPRYGPRAGLSHDPRRSTSLLRLYLALPHPASLLMCVVLLLLSAATRSSSSTKQYGSEVVNEGSSSFMLYC